MSPPASLGLAPGIGRSPFFPRRVRATRSSRQAARELAPRRNSGKSATRPQYRGNTSQACVEQASIKEQKKKRPSLSFYSFLRPFFSLITLFPNHTRREIAFSSSHARAAVANPSPVERRARAGCLSQRPSFFPPCFPCFFFHQALLLRRLPLPPHSNPDGSSHAGSSFRLADSPETRRYGRARLRARLFLRACVVSSSFAASISVVARCAAASPPFSYLLVLSIPRRRPCGNRAPVGRTGVGERARSVGKGGRREHAAGRMGKAFAFSFPPFHFLFALLFLVYSFVRSAPRARSLAGCPSGARLALPARL